IGSRPRSASAAFGARSIRSFNVIPTPLIRAGAIWRATSWRPDQPPRRNLMANQTEKLASEELADESKTAEDLKVIMREFAKELEAEEDEKEIEERLYRLAVIVITHRALKHRQQRLSA